MRVEKSNDVDENQTAHTALAEKKENMRRKQGRRIIPRTVVVAAYTLVARPLSERDRQNHLSSLKMNESCRISEFGL